MTVTKTLPAEEDEVVIDVSIRHIIRAFGGILIGAFVVGAGIVVVRDYTRFLRQKAVINAATELLKTLSERKEQNVSQT